MLGNGLSASEQHEDALTVKEAELSLLRRIGAPEGRLLVVQGNLAISYQSFGRLDEALSLRHDIYSGWLKLNGEEHNSTLRAANNYAALLKKLNRFEEAKVLLRKTMPVARRVLGESHRLILKMRWIYALVLYHNDDATLDELREAVETVESVAPSWKRVFGTAHPETPQVQKALANARAALARRAAATSSGAA